MSKAIILCQIGAAERLVGLFDGFWWKQLIELYSKNLKNSKRKGVSAEGEEESLRRATSNKNLILVMLLVAFLLCFYSFFAKVEAAEPSLVDILQNLGFTNIALTNVETFPQGSYNLTLYAEFAGYHDRNELSYYEVGTTTYVLVLSGPEGGYEYVMPPLLKTFSVDGQYGLSVYTPEVHRYFTQNSLNPDGQVHFKVYKNLDDPNMYLIGFENQYGAGDRDYQDMVFSLQLQYYLDVLSPYSTVSGEGWYCNGTTAYASLTEGFIDHGNGTRRTFTHWSGDASGTNYAQSDSIYMDGNKTAIANWKTEYLLTVRTSGLDTEVTNIYNGTTVLGTASDATPFTNWFERGATIELDVDSPIYGSPEMYVFTQWTGDASGSARPFTVVMDSSKDITANYETQYEVTFTHTGLDFSATGTVVTVNGSPKEYGDLPYTFWADEGAVITYSYSNVSSTTPDKRFILTGVTGSPSPITVIGSVTVTGNYKTQFQIIFNQAGADSDFIGTVVTIDGTDYTLTELPVSFWWDAGSTHDFAFGSPLIVGSGKRYVWTSTVGLSALQSDSITISTSGSVTGNYKTQYYLTVTSPYGDPHPTSDWFDDGTLITASVTSPWAGTTGTRYVCTGWSGTGSVPLSGTGASVTFTIDEPSSITWNWKTQYLLTVLTNPSGLNPKPTRNPVGEAGPANSWWFDASTSVTLTAQHIADYTFNYWDVNGASQGSGVNPITVDMIGPYTATAYYTYTSPPPPPPVGGYTVSLKKQTSASYMLVYAALVALFGVGVTLRKRKRKL